MLTNLTVLNWLRLVLLISAGLLAATAQALPEIQSWTTKNGTRVLFVEAHELPMLDIRVVFDAGSARDADKPGVASLTNALLDQGAAGMDAGAIAAGFEQYGAKLSGGAGRDMAWLTLRSLSDKSLLTPSFELFGKVLSRPDFPERDFKREQSRTLTGLEYQKQKPGSIADKAFYLNVYGEHPYSGEPSGTEESVAALTADDLKTFYQRYYVASNAQIAMVGDLTSAQARAMSETLSNALPAGKKAEPLQAVQSLDSGETVFIDFPSSQSHVLMGAPGVRRGDPDYFTLYVGNHVLGGSGLVSRISQEIRDKRGLSYSAYSYFVPMKELGPYTLGFQTRNTQRDEALKVLRDTLQTYIDEGPTAEELKASKSNITGGFPLRVASNSKIVEYLAVIGFYDLPLDYLSTFNANIEAVTAEQIRDAYKRRINVDDMITITVGGKAQPDS
jgi:zinc protease